MKRVHSGMHHSAPSPAPYGKTAASVPDSPNSTSSLEGADCNRDDATFVDSKDFYCCLFSSVPIKKGMIIVVFLTTVQLILHFFVFLVGCGVSLLHVLIATLPIVVGWIVISLTVYGVKINDGICLKPFIGYHICAIFTFSAILTIHAVRHFSGNALLTRALKVYEERLFSDDLSDAYTKIGFGLYLLANLAVNLISLQVGIGCYTYLENYRQYLCSEVTDV